MISDNKTDKNIAKMTCFKYFLSSRMNKSGESNNRDSRLKIYMALLKSSVQSIPNTNNEYNNINENVILSLNTVVILCLIFSENRKNSNSNSSPIFAIE